MANFYATYPASAPSSISVATVQGEGTPGSQTGGVLTVQGDPSGTPIPISGNITASSASVAPTGMAVPADADYVGMNVSGTLTGMTGTSSGLNVVVNAAIPAGANVIGAVTQSGAWAVSGTGTAGTAATGVVTVQGIASGTAVSVSGTGTAGTAASGVVTVQGIASGTAVSVSGTGTAGTAASGVVTIQGIASGTAVKVDPSGGTGAVNVTQFGGNAVVTGTGASGNGIPRVTVSNDSSLASVTTVSTVTAVTAITNALPAGTNLMGKVGIDQTTPGTTNAIQATSATAITWQAEGNVAAASVTTSYATVFTPSANTKILFMRNNTNQSIYVSMDAGTTTNFILDSGDQVAIDFVANGVISTTTAIQIKYSGSAPTTGSFRVNGGH